MKESKTLNLLDIISKPYQDRNPKQHTLMVQALHCYFPDLHLSKIKLFSFFTQQLHGPCDINTGKYTEYSFIISNFTYPYQNNQPIRNYQLLARDISITIKSGDIGVVLDYKDYLKCQALGDTSIEEELEFFRSSEYLCAIPRKTQLWMLRNVEVHNYKDHQTVYNEGQDIVPGQAGSGIYIVRNGEFVYSKLLSRHKKHVEVLTLSTGNLFGTIDVERDCFHNKYPKRLFTATSKTTNSIVYKLNRQAFVKKVKPYCQTILIKRQLKLLKFIVPQKHDKLNLSKQIRQLISPFKSTSVRLTNGYYSSREFTLKSTSYPPKSINFKSSGESQSQKKSPKNFESQSIGQVTFYTNSHHGRQQLPGLQNRVNRYSEKMAQDSCKKTSYLSLKREGPFRLCPMTKKKSEYFDSQFRDLDFLKDSSAKAKQVKRQDFVNKEDSIFKILMKNRPLGSGKTYGFKMQKDL